MEMIVMSGYADLTQVLFVKSLRMASSTINVLLGYAVKPFPHPLPLLYRPLRGLVLGLQLPQALCLSIADPPKAKSKSEDSGVSSLSGDPQTVGTVRQGRTGSQDRVQ